MPETKLTPDQVREIREAAVRREQLRGEARGLSNRVLARKFGVHERTVALCAQYLTHAKVAP